MKSIFLSIAVVLCVCVCSAQSGLLLMDMVHDNPGETPTNSKFKDPIFLDSMGYGAKVFFLSDAAQFGVNWQSFDTTIFPTGSTSRKWVEAKNLDLQQKYSATKAAGVKVYCELDMLVLPTALVTKYKTDICDANGKIDITKPFTQTCFRSLIQQMFDLYPQMDGLIIRTGETYLFDEPYHMGNSPVLHGMSDHRVLVKLLRDEVCVQRDKDLIYRTWDAGQFHSLPKYYLSVADSIPVHPRLYFSIKHTIVDFWRNGITNPALNYFNFGDYWIDDASNHGVYFNPCLGLGQHKQIVEVQCQREYEGKAAHPNYIAKGVIDGLEELKQPGLPVLNSLNSFKTNPLFAGTWTWSRGGGWGGPYITNEFWAELNAFVIAKWTQDPSRTEEDIFTEFARQKGLPDNQIAIFHHLCLLSDQGVMGGQYSNMGSFDVGWTRDDNFNGIGNERGYIDGWIDRNQTEAYIKEKAESLAIWLQIEALSKKLHFSDPALTHFVQVSCTYGRYKYQLFNAAWDIMIRGRIGDKGGAISEVQMEKDIASYDSTLNEWRNFVAANADAPTMYSTLNFRITINKYRDYNYTDGLVKFTAKNNDARIHLAWETAKKYHDHFDIQRSADSINWNTIQTLDGKDTTYQANAYEAYDDAFAEGRNYYRILLYDTTGTLTISQAIAVDALKHADLTGGTAVSENGKVKVSWQTSAEQFNDFFKVLKSTDGTHWKLLQLVDGSGTTSLSHNYEVNDSNPANGLNYYRLNYYYKGKRTVSPVATVDVANTSSDTFIKGEDSRTSETATVLKVHPNPVKGDIHFSLTNYKGTQVTVSLLGASGNAIQTKTIPVTKDNSIYTFSLLKKPVPGIYFLKVTGPGLGITNKIVIE